MRSTAEVKALLLMGKTATKIKEAAEKAGFTDSDNTQGYGSLCEGSIQDRTVREMSCCFHLHVPAGICTRALNRGENTLKIVSAELWKGDGYNWKEQMIKLKGKKRTKLKLKSGDFWLVLFTADAGAVRTDNGIQCELLLFDKPSTAIRTVIWCEHGDVGRFRACGQWLFGASVRLPEV